jgi:transcriptional regulator with XRE-family HTH domain
MSIGKKILRARQELNLTQKQLAEKMGQDSSAVARWETDVFKPSAKNIEKLAAVLNKEYKYFYEDLYPALPAEVRDAAKHSAPSARAGGAPLTAVVKKGEALFFDTREIPYENNPAAPQMFNAEVRDKSLSPDFEEGDVIEFAAVSKPADNKYHLVEIKKSQFIYKVSASGGELLLTIGNQKQASSASSVKILARAVAVRKTL